MRRAHFGAAVKLNVLLNAKSGRLKGDQAERLRAAGVFSYNHNLNTSERIAGGREVQLGWLQPLGLEVANSIFVGDYLTTTGQPPSADFAMIRDLGLSILGHEAPAPAEAPTPGGDGGPSGAGRLIPRTSPGPASRSRP